MASIYIEHMEKKEIVNDPQCIKPEPSPFGPLM